MEDDGYYNSNTYGTNLDQEDDFYYLIEDWNWKSLVSLGWINSYLILPLAKRTLSSKSFQILSYFVF